MLQLWVMMRGTLESSKLIWNFKLLSIWHVDICLGMMHWRHYKVIVDEDKSSSIFSIRRSGFSLLKEIAIMGSRSILEYLLQGLFVSWKTSLNPHIKYLSSFIIFWFQLLDLFAIAFQNFLPLPLIPILHHDN